MRSTETEVPRGIDEKVAFSQRPVRVPIGTRNVLTAPQRPGFVRRFVNDEPGRISQFEGAGYTVVKATGDDAQVGDPKVGKGLKPGSGVSLSVGGGSTAVLMEIREEWYNEDQKVKQDRITASENDMRRQIDTKKEGVFGEVSIT